MLQATKLIIEGLRDSVRRAKHFGLFRSPKNLIQAKAELQKDIHLIERALALPEPRRPFGNAPVKRVEDIIANYGDQLGKNLLSQAKTVLDNRNSWNEKGLRPKQITLPAATGVEKLLVSRRSVRAFGSDKQISDIELEQVIALAVQAPSVSNTQSWSVRAYREPQDITDILKLQDGNVGSSPVPVLLVVTVDIRNFTGSNERNQMWIDGGIFSAAATAINSCSRLGKLPDELLCHQQPSQQASEACRHRRLRRDHLLCVSWRRRPGHRPGAFFEETSSRGSSN